MGFRFRKSIKILPGVRLNINKDSHSWTFGGKGMHYTVNKKKGYTSQSVDLPGGFSYQERSKISDKRMNNRTKPAAAKKPFYKKRWFIALIVIMILYVIGSLTEDPTAPKIESVELDPYTTELEVGDSKRVDYTVVPENADISALEFVSENDKQLEFKKLDSEGLIVAGDVPGEYEIYAKWGYGDDEQSKHITITVIDPNEEVKQEADNTTETADYVYISATGSKYHRKSTCSGMADATEMTKNEAIAQGYAPCGKCY